VEERIPTTRTRLFHIAPDKEIKSGRVADVYFQRTMDILAAKGMDKYVAAEVRARTLPRDWPWAVLAGVEECAHLLAGLDCSVHCLDEGTLFRAGDPVMVIEGNYTAFGLHETAFLGFLCQASGIATGAARCRIAAGERVLLSFGARRMHPAIAPMIERSAYIGGCDSVSAIAGADLIGIEPTGTMPHALVLVMGDTVAATQAFHEVVAPHVRRISLIDTFRDEKFETLRVAEAMGEALFGVRLDTPGSRRGDFLEILREVRWELDLWGFQDVRLFVSGGIDETQIRHLNPAADGYGVGTSISNAPTIDSALDIVEIEGQPMAKRGKRSGVKQLWRCPACGESRVTPRHIGEVTSVCGQTMTPLLRPLIKGGEIVRELPAAQAIRQHVLAQLAALENSRG
jgi:nicotinate phosphoribosyltransferase